jgi:hypothetical protein
MKGPPLSVLLCICGTTAASLIQSVNELSAAINAAQSAEGRTVGFLSQGNYDAVASVLPRHENGGGQLRTLIFGSLDELEAAVVSGEIVAGLSTSRPHNDDGHLIEFSASLITLRASMLKPSLSGGALDSQQLREAWDASVVRAIHEGTYSALEAQYFASNQFDSVAAFTCGIDPGKFPFPDASSATGLLAQVLSSGKLKVAALGPYDWGYQGNYSADPPTGLWADYLQVSVPHMPHRPPPPSPLQSPVSH